MPFDKKNLLRLCLFFLVFLAAGATARAVTITRTSSPVFYMDASGNPQALQGMYASYRVTNTGAYQPDLWVTAGSFTGGVISLAPNEDGVIRLGAMEAGETKTAFFYLQASAPTVVPQQHTVRVYNARPTTGTVVASASFTLTVLDTIQALANKVNTVISGPNPSTLGGTLTMTVTGKTGTIGAARVLAFTPAAYLGWAASSFELYRSTITLSGGNTGTYTDQLLIPATSVNTNDTDYTAVYLFRAVNFTGGPTAVSPVAFISSGTQVKHTDTSGYAQLSPIQQITNTTVVTKLANTSFLYSPGVVTYTARLSNSGPTDVNIDEVVDTLPTTPAAATYVANSSAYGGVPVGEPAISGATLTWARTFTVPAGQTRDLTYRVSIPSALGTYTNRVVGNIATVQIDTTLAIGDNSPAATDVQMTTPPNVALDKCVYVGAQCVKTTSSAPPGSDLVYQINFGNTGNRPAQQFVLTDPVPADTDFKLGSVVTSPGSFTGVTVEYSADGSTWTTTPPTPQGSEPAGYNRNVRHIRWLFTGGLNFGSTGSVSFTVRIR